MTTGSALSPPKLPGRRMTMLPVASLCHSRDRSFAKASSQAITLQLKACCKLRQVFYVCLHA